MPDLKAALQEHRNLRAQLLESFPELSEDEAALADSLEGISSLDQQILATMRHAVLREAHARGIALLMEQLTQRKRRLEEGAARIRAICLNCMQEAGLPKIAGPDMGLTVGKGRAKVEIPDEERLPAEWFRVTRAPDRARIGEALKAGEEVPGCHLGNQAPILTVRMS